MSEQLFILTKSSKKRNESSDENHIKGYCVAGLRRNPRINNRWEFIRLVTDRSGNSLDENQAKALDALDVVNVNLMSHVGSGCQTENYLYEWSSVQFVKSLSAEQTAKFFHNYKTQLPFDQSVFGNSFNYLTQSQINYRKNSLIIVDAHNVRLHETTNSSGSTKTKISFMSNGTEHSDYSMTDPDYYGNTQSHQNAFLIISIPNKEFNGKYYKFVAKIIPY